MLYLDLTIFKKLSNLFKMKIKNIYFQSLKLVYEKSIINIGANDEYGC